jgi:hypothetical protein
MTSDMKSIDCMLCAALGLGLMCLGCLSGSAFFEPPLVKHGACVIGFVMLLTAAPRNRPVCSVAGIETSWR